MIAHKKSSTVIHNLFGFADTVLFSVFLVLLILPYIGSAKRTWIIIPIGFAVYLLVAVIRKRSHTAELRKKSLYETQQRKIEQLLLLSDEDLSRRFGKNNFILIRKERPDKFDVLDAIRKHADAIGMFTQDAAMIELIRSYSPGTDIYCKQDLLDEDAEKKDGGARGRAISHRNEFLPHLNKYLVLGILFFIVSFILHAKIYYRVVSSACLITAAVSGFLRDLKRSKNFLIFLDKRDD